MTSQGLENAEEGTYDSLSSSYSDVLKVEPCIDEFLTRLIEGQLDTNMSLDGLQGYIRILYIYIYIYVYVYVYIYIYI